MERKVDLENRGYRSGQCLLCLSMCGSRKVYSIRCIQTRLVDDAISSLQRTLDWAGLDYDEGKLYDFAKYGFLPDSYSCIQRSGSRWRCGAIYPGDYTFNAGQMRLRRAKEDSHICL